MPKPKKVSGRSAFGRSQLPQEVRDARAAQVAILRGKEKATLPGQPRTTPFTKVTKQAEEQKKRHAPKKGK